MKQLLLTCLLLIGVGAFAQLENVFYDCTFDRLSGDQFQLYAYFSGAADNCFETQYRTETLQNDTLFLSNLYVFPFIIDGFGCSRTDTLTQTNFSANIQYIHVCAGTIVYNTDSSDFDTTFHRFDTTFVRDLAVGATFIETFNWSASENHLIVTGNAPVQLLCIYTINGELLLCENNNQAHIHHLASGVYLMRIIAADQTAVLRWYKP